MSGPTTFGDISNDQIAIEGGTDGTKIGNVGDKLKVTDLDVLTALTSSGVTVRSAGTDITKVFNIGIGSSYTSPAFPSIKPLGSYIVPSGKTLKVHGAMYKTAASTTFFHLFARKLMWKFNAVALATPGVITATNKTITGAQLSTNSTYKYVVVAVNIVGKTLPSPQKTVVLTGTENAVTLSWSAVTGTMYYEVYRTKAGMTSLGLLAKLETLTYTDAAPDAQTETSINPPVSNTTAGSVDGDSYQDPIAASMIVVDTLTAITTPLAMDVIYKNVYNEVQYVTVTPAAAAAGQVEVSIKGRTNPTNNNRIPASNNKKQLVDISMQDILSISNTPATGSFAVFGSVQLIQTASPQPNRWQTDMLTTPYIAPSGTELSFGISSLSAVTTASRSDFYLIASLE